MNQADLVDADDLLAQLDTGSLVRVRGDLWEVASAPQVTADGTCAVLRLRASGDGATGNGTLDVIVGKTTPVEQVEPVRLPGIFDRSDGLSAYPEWRTLAMALRLGAVGAGDRPSSLEDARIELAWYQYEPVVKALAQRVPRLLIADDVGLGKTVEAGLILMELRARRRADRILVVVPANLQDQWREELWSKFGLPFKVFDREGIAEAEGELEVGENAWKRTPLIITSVDLVKDRAHRRALLDDPDLRWDVVIFDEAHHVAPTAAAGGAVRPTLRSELAAALAERCDALLLLTATPHDGYRQSFTALLGQLDPSLLPDPDNISDEDRKLISKFFVRRLKAWLRDENGQRIFRPRFVETRDVWMEGEELKLYQAIARHIERKRRWAEKAAEKASDRGERQRARVASFAMEVMKKRLGSSWGAISTTLRRRVDARKKALSQQQAAADEAAAATVDAADLNHDAEALAQGEDMTEAAAEAAANRLLEAVQATQEEIVELERLTVRAEKVAAARTDAKLGQLRSLLAQVFNGTCEVKGRKVSAERIVVFTEYLDTRDYLYDGLKDEPWADGGAAIVRMEGGMGRKKREAALAAFQKCRLLLATDAISEGINLQDYAHVVVHAEIPWNPNRLEQRNGRVDRKNQKKDVFVFNLLLASSYEGRVLARVLRKLEKIREDVGGANAVVGGKITLDVLGPMVNEDDLKSKLLGGDETDAARAEASGTELEQLIDDRRKIEGEFRERTGLFATEFGPKDIVEYRKRLQSLRPDAVTPADVETFVVRSLAAEGVALRPDPAHPTAWLPWSHGVPGLDWARDALRPHPDEPDAPDNAPRSFTFERERALVDPKVAFVTSQHPLVAILVAQARQRLWRSDIQSRAGRLAHGPAASPDEIGSTLFTFEGHLVDGAGSLVERRLLPVYVEPNGAVSKDPEDDARRAFCPRKGEPRSGAAAARVQWAQTVLAAARQEAARRLNVRANELRADIAARVEESLVAFDAALPRRKQALLTALAVGPQQELDLTAADKQRRTRLERRLRDFDRRAQDDRARIEARRDVRVASSAGTPARDLACLLLVETA